MSLVERCVYLKLRLPLKRARPAVGRDSCPGRFHQSGSSDEPRRAAVQPLAGGETPNGVGRVAAPTRAEEKRAQLFTRKAYWLPSAP